MTQQVERTTGGAGERRDDGVVRQPRPPRTVPRSTDAEPVLEAVGIEKAYRRGMWPARRGERLG
jgi:hypothetical protein